MDLMVRDEQFFEKRAVLQFKKFKQKKHKIMVANRHEGNSKTAKNLAAAAKSLLKGLNHENREGLLLFGCSLRCILIW